LRGIVRNLQPFLAAQRSGENGTLEDAEKQVPQLKLRQPGTAGHHCPEIRYSFSMPSTEPYHNANSWNIQFRLKWDQLP
jgi:hypothetical protein